MTTTTGELTTGADIGIKARDIRGHRYKIDRHERDPKTFGQGEEEGEIDPQRQAT